MALFEAELNRHRWSDLQCGCGGYAVHVPEMLRRMADQPDREEFTATAPAVTGHLLSGGEGLVPVSLTFLKVAFAALPGLDGVAKKQFLEAILDVIGPATDMQSESDLAAACVRVGTEGVSLLYAELDKSGSIDCAAYAFDLLILLDADRERVRLGATSFSRQVA